MVNHLLQRYMAVGGAISAVALAALVPSPAHAQQAAPPVAPVASPALTEGVSLPNNGTPPDVQIVVLALPTGQWGVSAVYPRRVPRKKAEERNQQLLALTGWKAAEVEWEERRMEQPYATKQPPIMSSLTYTTTGNAVDVANGTIAVEPFARAYRDLNRIHVTFLVPFKWNFKGLRRYSDNNLDVALSEGQGAYTYVVNIKNHKMEAVNLPLFDAVKQQATQRAETLETRKRNMRTGQIGAVILLAAGAGALAWVGVSRLTGR